MDISQYFLDTAALAAAIVSLVAFLRSNVLKNLQGAAVIALSLGVGAAAGVAGHLLGYLTGGLGPSVIFGLGAGLAASGGWDAITGLLGKSRPSPEG